jgi:hypothetical protein
MNRIPVCLAACLLLAAALTACTAALPAAEIPPDVSASPLAPTTLPTGTAKPTATPIPATPTVEPPALLADYLNAATIDTVLTFTQMPGQVDINRELVTAKDGVLHMQGRDWQGLLYAPYKYKEGQGALFDFMFEQDGGTPEFETYVDVGEWWTPSYRRFGVYLTLSPQANMWIGSQGSGKYLTGDLKLAPDVWYQVLLVVGENADFLGVIRDPANPGPVRSYRIPMGTQWAGNTWTFAINGTRGRMLIDNWMSISFSSIK